MQSNFGASMTISEFQKHLDNTLKIIHETTALTKDEAKDMTLAIDQMKIHISNLKNHTSELGLIDSIKGIFNYGVIPYLKDEVHKGQHILSLFINLNNKLMTIIDKQNEMSKSVEFLCRNFQSLIDSNKQLFIEVRAQRTMLEDQSKQISELKNQNEDQSKKMDIMLEMMKQQQQRPSLSRSTTPRSTSSDTWGKFA